MADGLPAKAPKELLNKIRAGLPRLHTQGFTEQVPHDSKKKFANLIENTYQ